MALDMCKKGDMMWDLLIKNADYVSEHQIEHGNIYVKDGKIAAISAELLAGDAKETIDATGRLVFPGFIDTHCHSRDGSKGAWYKEDFAHSSRAAAVGGITTILEMPNCNPAIYNVENLHDLIKTITPKAYVDFGVWGLCLGKLNNDSLQALADAGVVAFKFFWGYAIDAKNYQLIYNYEEGMKDVIPPMGNGEVYQLFRAVAKTGKLVGIHAEDFSIIKELTNEVRATGADDYEAMIASRPPLSETVVIDTAIQIAEATGAHLHILHLATGEGVPYIRRAQQEGYPITAETCPHYLTLTAEDYARVGTAMKGYPPVRRKKDQDELWAALREGVIAYVCSDHAPHSPEEKAKDLWSAPAGMVNIETMVPLMIDAVNAGKLTWQELVRVLSAEPAKMYGLYPHKGAIQVGADADIVLVDPEKKWTVDQEKLQSRTKLSAYHGMTLKGKIERTILRGHTVMNDGEICGGAEGRFVRPDKETERL